MKITVLGSGAWGTALALLLLENGNDVTLWSYTEEESAVLRETHENPMLKGVPLPEKLKFSTDMACVKGCGLVVMATPSFAVRSTAGRQNWSAGPCRSPGSAPWSSAGSSAPWIPAFRFLRCQINARHAEQCG